MSLSGFEGAHFTENGSKERVWIDDIDDMLLKPGSSGK